MADEIQSDVTSDCVERTENMGEWFVRVSHNRPGWRDLDALPDIVREELPDGPRRTCSVKARHESGQYVFRATLTWPPPGRSRQLGTNGSQEGTDGQLLFRAKTQVTALRREFAEDGMSEQLAGLDSLFSVAEEEVDRLITRRRAEA